MSKVYVVQDYDCVEYAGTNLTKAKAKVKGFNHIAIWQDGKMVGFVGYKNNKWYVHYY